MNRALRSAARRLAFPALLVLVSSTAAADGGSQTRPFKARLTLTETVAFTGTAPCFGIGTVQAVGTATYLGNTTVTSRDCITVQAGSDPGAPLSFSFSSIGSGPDGLVFTAANGDTVFASYSGTVTPQASGPHVVAGQFVITGGTGRFAGATGGGTLSGREDISQVVSGYGEIEAVGSIRY